ncbi:aminoglycoside N(3)-acetyltransferase [Kitasatospora sp. NPDC101447]|uniref:aminoglycoside N(3)-acetyltransferase n=1 Tax=Kitasatospora sp. NPDC101447 TaxID=3364102 RepID=UPI003817946F
MTTDDGGIDMNTAPPTEPLNATALQGEFESLGVRPGSVLMVHSSLSAFGRVDGGADAVVQALRAAVGRNGTIVVPAYTRQVADPHPDRYAFDDPRTAAARAAVPTFHDALPTAMGAIPSAVLAHPDRVRSRHPQASLAALGADARTICAEQPLGYALGNGSPFARIHQLGGSILLLGVGHNRNSFLHHAESLVPTHRKKLRRFPYLVDGERVWLETPDVGDDNDTYFPLIGEEFAALGLSRSRVIGSAVCQLVPAVGFVDYARRRLSQLLPRTG